jgi:hypothetical protein
VLDGVAVGGTTGATSFQAPAPLPDGKHTLQVITVDRRGQVVPSAVRSFAIDTVPPTAELLVAGRKRRGRRLQVRVAAADAGSGLAAVTVDYGDRSRRGQEAETVHRWRKRGRYRVTARVTDVAGNVTTAAVRLRIRR